MALAHPRPHIRHNGDNRSFHVDVAQSLLPSLGGRLHQAQWNGAETGNNRARLAPSALAISTARSTAPCGPKPPPDPDRCHWPPDRPRPVPLWQQRPWPFRNPVPAAPPWRQRPPALPPALPCRARARAARCLRRLNAPAAHRAEYSPRLWPATKAGLSIPMPSASKRTHGRNRRRHQRWLCVLGQSQRFLVPLPDQRAELFAQSLVHLFEHRRAAGYASARSGPCRLSAPLAPEKYMRCSWPVPFQQSFALV